MNKETVKAIRRHDKVCADRIEKVLAEEKKIGNEKLEHLEAFYKKFAKAEYLAGKIDIKEELKRLIEEEMAIAHKEGTPTSRLTSLYMKLQDSE